jgi:hypothetical protein
MDANGQLCENTKYGDACDLNQTVNPIVPILLVVRRTYRNPFWVNDIQQLVSGTAGEPSHGCGAMSGA